jgi:Zn ribbon nucleic-acid-binding protein
MNTLLDAIDGAEKSGSDTYQAPCPNCNADDHLVIWPDSGDTGQVYCRKCGWGRRTHPSESVDGIEYMQKVEGMSFHEACEFFGVERESAGDGKPESAGQDPPGDRPALDVGKRPADTSGVQWQSYDPPGETWRDAARSFCRECKDRLWSDETAAQSALEYLKGRGLTQDTIEAAGLGVNHKDRFHEPERWGLDSDSKVWLPRGVVIPWADSEGVSGVNIRRPAGDVQPGADEEWKGRKYQRAPGPSAPLYGVPWIEDGNPVVLVEGEFDALAVAQVALDVCSPVATGSTGGARRSEWRDLLADAPAVLVAFDDEAAGESASLTWIDALPNATRWPPHAADTGEMLEQGKDLRMWVRCGLHAARRLF